MSISEAKSAILSLKGKPVRLLVSRGRNKTDVVHGEITDLFPAVFTVTLDENQAQKTASFSYSDLICGAVKIRKPQ